jgi:hypothetical protein
VRHRQGRPPAGLAGAGGGMTDPMRDGAGPRRGRHRAPVWRGVRAEAHRCHRTPEGPGRAPGARRVA